MARFCVVEETECKIGQERSQEQEEKREKEKNKESEGRRPRGLEGT